MDVISWLEPRLGHSVRRRLPLHMRNSGGSLDDEDWEENGREMLIPHLGDEVP